MKDLSIYDAKNNNLKMQEQEQCKRWKRFQVRGVMR